MRVFLCSSIMAMFIIINAAFAQETITVQPDDKVVTNASSARVKSGPIEDDLIKSVSLAENTLFSIKLNATNFDRYIRITSYSTNLDFVRFTRDKTNAFLTFRTLTAGIGKLDFQVDNEESIIRNVGTVDGKETNEVDTPYEVPEIGLESSIVKDGTKRITNTEEKISYTITYKAEIKDYIGEGQLTIVDYLPYPIDENN